MAVVTWIATTASTWATAASWSSGTVPVSGDDVVFNNSANGNCTYNSALTSQYKSLTTTGYTGILTVSSTLQMQANSTITLSSSHTLTGTGTFVINGLCTITSGGCVIDAGIRTSATVGGTYIIEIADDCSFSRSLIMYGVPLILAAFRSNVPGTVRKFTMLNTVNTSSQVDYTNFTDIDNSAGVTIWSYAGTISNCLNIGAMTPHPPTVSGIILQ